MKELNVRFYKHLIYVLLLCQSIQLFSQNFRRIETQSGLGALKDNTGVAVADFDGDNDLDIFVVARAKDDGTSNTESKLFKNNNDGTFTDVTILSGLGNLHPFEDSHSTDPLNTVTNGYQDYKWGVSWADYDNDGDPDLFFTNSYRVLLYNNQGNGTFLDVTDSAKIKGFNRCFNTSSLWFDYNNDGFLDLYISDYNSSCGKNTLYKNKGDGTFEDVSDSFVSAVEGSNFTFMAMPIDVNDDGWLDLYLANDFGRNDLFINQNGQGFKEESVAYGLDNEETGMALSIGDYDNNGEIDLYLSNISINALYVKKENIKYENVAPENNISNGSWAWGSKFADFDLDGDEDIILVNGYDNRQHGNLYFNNLLNVGETGFTDISENVNIKEFTFSLTPEVFDYDNDGDLDIFITNKKYKNSFFYDNTTIDDDTSEGNNWFKVNLEGVQSNRDGLGATVIITTSRGTYKRNYNGAGLYSQSLQSVHFGVADATNILELKILWPLGLVDTYTNIGVNNTILAKEGQGYQILDIQPSVKVIGCTDPNSCNYNPLAIISSDNCTYIETKEIVGSTNSSYLETEIYSYTKVLQGGTLNWNVEGGEILEILDENTVKIKWGLEKEGKVKVTEVSNCASLPAELTVDLEAPTGTSSKHSVARLWNEALLEAIRGDYARPTIHARNLFHTSIALYDAWSLYDLNAKPYLIGQTVHGFKSVFKGFITTKSIEESRKKTMSYAVYRLLNERFKNSPNALKTLERFDLLMESLGYDTSFTSTDYTTGDTAALGNFIAETILNYGYTDGSREKTGYDNAYYSPINDRLAPIVSGNSTLTNPNRWQPLSLDVFIDQSGNLIEEEIPEFLSPEWGNVFPFSLKEENKISRMRSGNTYNLYNNLENPPSLNLTENSSSSDAYKWGFSLVSMWGSHLDPTDNVMWDISPKAIGNIDVSLFPKNYQDLPDFYNTLEGGDISVGHSVNPITNSPYESQYVPRGDYARVLAEFWADGPDSETPPGHWFTLLNYVSDHPLLEKKIGGEGEVLNNLEWDVKSYFIMAGTMHDASISAWSIKGWYDYIRPISAIRFMADKGQSTDNTKPNYHIAGIPLKPGYVETVEAGDPLEGREKENIGKIKVYSWKGHSFIGNPEVDQAGVGWVLAENWWPYQRPSFVTPPFAGFVSGHSTYSRAAAEVMTLLTGDAYFPGGYGEFIAKKNEFLVFEEGPSMDIKLQWATYRDASDQCSLSRIWGGIHPPVDDIPGRVIGAKLGVDSYNFAISYFNGKELPIPNESDITVYPNPITDLEVTLSNTKESDEFVLFDVMGRKVEITNKRFYPLSNITFLNLAASISPGIYVLKINKTTSRQLIIK